MTKHEFCKKWEHGWRKVYFDGSEAYFFTKEQMIEDLDKVIHETVLAWKDFVDSQVKRAVNLDDWQVAEIEQAVKHRKD